MTLHRPLPGYAELHCRSNFSFLTGASHPEELVTRAVQLGYSALAITDECSLAGVVRAHAEAQRQRLHLIIGSEMQLTLPPAHGVRADHGEAPAAPRLVLLAQTRRGYGNLSRWITVARRRAEKGCYLAHPGDVEGKVPHAPFLVGLPDCLALLVPQPGQPFESLFAQAMWLKTWFGERAGLAVELLHRPGDDELLERLLRVREFTGLPLVAAGDVLMHVRSRKPLQDTLTATRLRQPVAQCGWQLAPNAEQHLRSRARLGALYAPEWLHNTLAWAGQCCFSLAELRYEYPQEIVPPGQTPTGHLHALTMEGLREKYPQGAPAAVVQRVAHELRLIETLKYEAYFLTVADLVRWARAQGILCQGRGSAANSVVCYCLGVTAVDPAESTLLFERFISVERNEPPDIDVDFEHQRREEVIQYIYRKYGRHRTAITAVVTCYRPRSALRDAGRALGLDEAVIRGVAKSQQWFDGRSIDTERLRENGLDPDAPVARLWVTLTEQLIGFPRHLSQHTGGFLIACEDISLLVPVENAAMENRTVIQWDKDDLDTLKLLKVDVLALGMLSAIRRGLVFVGQKLGRSLQMHEVPREDTATYDMVCKADTVGVFQIESRAQMSMLPRLQPRTYYDLVVQVSIVRPGPIQGGMVHPYLQRRAGKAPVNFVREELREALGRTLGVPIFQEQVMQIAMIAADFTPGEADGLRRAMAAWKRPGGLGHYHDRLVGRMKEKGYPDDFAENLFKQIQGFGEYGFPESHAASFAKLVYVSSWLKCHHPDAFLAALLNSQPMGFYAPAQLVRDARAHGVTVLPVDVRASDWESSLAPAGDALPGPGLQPVRLGLQRIKGLSEDAGGRIVAARVQAPFQGVDDLARRAGLQAPELQALAEADALQGLARHRHQAAWAVAGIDTRLPLLLRDTPVEEAPAELPPPSEGETLRADYRALGLTLGRHPLALLRGQLHAFRVQPAEVLRGYPHGRLARASGLVTHRQRPPTAKGIVFVTLEDETGPVNVVVWPTVADAQRKPLLAATLLTVYGRWQRQGEGDHAVTSLLATTLVDHSDLLSGLASRSRDFQ